MKKQIMREEKISSTLETIHSAFAGVQLGRGISWREADILDAYGMEKERERACNIDEKFDWSKLSDDLIGAPHWQCVLSFLDAEGLHFYLPSCMCYVLRCYRSSDSVITDSTYTICQGHRLKNFTALLTESQCNAIRGFLQVCLEIGDDWLDVSGIPEALEQV